jgi:hypothetical protein
MVRVGSYSRVREHFVSITTGAGRAMRPTAPLSPVGGTDDESNLQALCAACNLSKGAA